jgi:hypothetical protein
MIKKTKKLARLSQEKNELRQQFFCFGLAVYKNMAA